MLKQKSDVMANEKIYTQPKLYPTSRSLKKTWLVEFRYLNPTTGKLQTKQFRDNLNELKTVKERLARGKVLCQSYADLLADGWNPFSNEIDNTEEKMPLSLAEQLEQLLLLKKSVWTARTLRSYTDHCKQFTKWLTKKKYDKLLPKFFTQDRAQAYMDYCITALRYSGKSYNTRLGALRSFFNSLVKRKIVERNPFTEIDRLPEVQNEHASFSGSERQTIREHLRQHNPRIYYAVQFVYYCFLRRTELAQLKVGDIDLERKTIRIAGKKAKSRRSESVTIPKSFEPILIEMGINKLPKDHYIFGRNFETAAEVIPKPDYFSDAHKRELDKLDLKTECTFYSWKHTGATALYQATKDIYVVMKQCRHTDISITMIYLRSLGLIVDEVVRNADFEF
jgi:integrase